MSGSSDKLAAIGALHMQDSSRRELLRVTAAAVAATVLGVSKAIPATPPVKTISHGEFSITVLSDGHLTIPTRFLARNASEAEIKTAIGLTSDFVTPPCNITLVQIGRASCRERVETSGDGGCTTRNSVSNK